MPQSDVSLDAPYGEVVQLSPLVARLLAPNPGPFTFTGTGVYLIGSDPVAVIDPGPDLPAHRAALEKALAGRRVSHILITHTHLDHSPAAAWAKAWSGAPTYGFGPHPVAAGDVEAGGDHAFVPDVTLHDGRRIAGEGFTFTAIHTPGHISNHLCFALEEEAALFCGDHVMGWSTTVIAPPGGDMGDYMASLDKLLPRQDRIYYPTHGAPIEKPRAFVSAMLGHRRAREAQVLDALRRGTCTIPALVAALYAGLDQRLHRAAALTVEAHLIKLEKDGRVVRDGERWHSLAHGEEGGASAPDL
jgi:glyoxylase-like metal-dependent hydrolase (beta-lactamase superfamily II)